MEPRIDAEPSSPTAERSIPPLLTFSRKFLGGSLASISSVSSSGSEFPDEEAETEDRLFIAVDESNRDELRELFEDASDRALEVLLQIMITRTWSDNGSAQRRYFFEEDAIKDAEALMGCSTAHLNVLQISIFQGEEELALDILDYFHRATEKLGGRRALLHEFLAHQFGYRNTSLHLAAFMGMADLCRRLLELGANSTVRNSRNFRPVDCTNDEGVRQQFLQFKHGWGREARLAAVRI